MRSLIFSFNSTGKVAIPWPLASSVASFNLRSANEYCCVAEASDITPSVSKNFHNSVLFALPLVFVISLLSLVYSCIFAESSPICSLTISSRVEPARYAIV